MDFVSPILGIISAVSGFMGSKEEASSGEAAAGQQEAAAGQQERAAQQQEASAEQSRRIAMQNAASTEAETAEQVRQERKSADQAGKTRRAKAAAGGGVISYGSTGAFLDEQVAREDSAIDWLRQAGANRADIEREQGDYSYLEGLSSANLTRANAQGTRAGATATRGQASATRGRGLTNLLTGVGSAAADMPEIDWSKMY